MNRFKVQQYRRHSGPRDASAVRQYFRIVDSENDNDVVENGVEDEQIARQHCDERNARASRYGVQAYAYRGGTRYRILDTLNGGVTVEHSFFARKSAEARCNELNETREERAVRLNNPKQTRDELTASLSLRVLQLVEDGEMSPIDALREVCGANIVDQMIDALYDQLRMKGAK